MLTFFYFFRINNLKYHSNKFFIIKRKFFF